MNGQHAQGSKYTVWHFVGCGCTALLILGLIVAGGVFWFGREMVQGLKAGIEDPEERVELSRQILGWDELPEGYRAGITVRVPFVMTMTTLGDRELPEGEMLDGGRVDADDMGELFGTRGFLYFKIRTFGSEPEEIEENADLDFDFDPERRLGDGEVEAGGATVAWVARLGIADLADGRARTISTDLTIRCLADPYARRAIWFEKAPELLAAEGAGQVPPEGEQAALVGTPADPEAIGDFLDHFDLCG